MDSPSKWSSGAEHILLAAEAVEDVTAKMRVPHSIRANGEAADEDYHIPNGFSVPPAWLNASEKFDMNVPDRIMLIGQDRHIGTRAPPREIMLENSVFDVVRGPEDVRVSTPPRTITLEKHAFPSAAETPTSSPVRAPFVLATPPAKPNALARLPSDFGMTPYRDGSSPENASMLAEESLVLLRRQVAGINRRVMALEMELVDRQQREKFVCALGIAYIVYKIISWLNRS